MKIYKDGRVADYKQIFSQVSLPASGPSDEFLAEQGAYKVNVYIDHDRATQKLVPADPYIKDGWAYTVTVADKTEDEIAADTNARSSQVRAQRDQLLIASDWTQVLDSPVDRTAWATYRDELRRVPEQAGFPWDITWPNQPGA